MSCLKPLVNPTASPSFLCCVSVCVAASGWGWLACESSLLMLSMFDGTLLPCLTWWDCTNKTGDKNTLTYLYIILHSVVFTWLNAGLCLFFLHFSDFLSPLYTVVLASNMSCYVILVQNCRDIAALAVTGSSKLSQTVALQIFLTRPMHTHAKLCFD